MSERIIAWTPAALRQMEKILDYQEERSSQGADALKPAIVAAIEMIPLQPKRHPQDYLKKRPHQDFRAFEVQRYRVSYRILPDRILIVRIRHTSMEPKHY